MASILLTCEGPEMAANDILWEGLIALITLIHLRECVTSLIMQIILHELEELGAAVTEFGMPGWVHVRYSLWILRPKHKLGVSPTERVGLAY